MTIVRLGRGATTLHIRRHMEAVLLAAIPNHRENEDMHLLRVVAAGVMGKVEAATRLVRAAVAAICTGRQPEVAAQAQAQAQVQEEEEEDTCKAVEKVVGTGSRATIAGKAMRNLRHPTRRSVAMPARTKRS
jgi:hypothetical protein